MYQQTKLTIPLAVNKQYRFNINLLYLFKQKSMKS